MGQSAKLLEVWHLLQSYLQQTGHLNQKGYMYLYTYKLLQMQLCAFAESNSSGLFRYQNMDS